MVNSIIMVIGENCTLYLGIITEGTSGLTILELPC